MKTKLSFLALAALLFMGLPLESSSGAVFVSVGVAPPVIPIYEQPYAPGPGYIWVPGYWAYGPYGYYWVPGTWVLPPGVGLLWTPGYWAHRGGNYVFIDGYWGHTVGYYGGINYGFGYFGSGYYGGRWSGNTFLYNTAVTRVGSSITTTYVDREPLKFKSGNRAAFNGPGGVQAKPTAREQAAAKEKHIKPTATQRSLAERAGNDPALRATDNKGKPKAEAVRAAQNQTREGAGTTARKEQAAEKKTNERAGAGNARQTNVNERNKSQKTTERTAKAANQPRREVNTARTRQASTEQARKVEPRKAQNAPREVRRVSSAPRRVQSVKSQPGPSSARGGRAQTQNQEKKKKKDKEKPGGG